MSDITAQYTLREHCQLIVSHRIRRWLLGRLFYLESDLVFGDVIQRGGGVQRDGRHNLVVLPEVDLGTWSVRLRRHTSDFRVFREIVLMRQYQVVVELLRRCDDGDPVSAIVDAGANIGLSAIYFARSFPEANVIALEPDDGNYDACCDNIQRAGVQNVLTRRHALWKEDTTLDLRSDFRDGREWARSVAPGSSGEGSVQGVSMSTLLAECRLEKIDLLKIDIEGAEAALFDDASRLDSWLPKVKCLVVEIHEPPLHEVIVSHLRAHEFIVFDRQDFTLAVRRDLIRPAKLLEFFQNEPAHREVPLVA